MNLEQILSTIRTGEGELGPIIEYYADIGEESELIPYLDDQDVLPTILYILSELPRVHEKMLKEIEMRVEIGNIPDSARAWAEDILFNHR